jgi:5'-3' exoribonuclease 1
MGVPKFYRWISERYPQINQMLSGTTILPEFDNFYLDMNGIIHACTHPNDNSTANSLTMREMMLAIFRYIDHMVTEIVKPKKILFMAIDGVAPRAKLNQQRARRFRAAQERVESVAKAREKGEVIDEETLFDSNCITPGTEFMETVGKHLRYFIRKKIKEDPLWRNLKIVFSGHDVPGEGEHKIMQFIRDLRADPNYEPNQRHCMYGQDADLIMLGLATHEPHFALLREVVNFNFNRGGGSSRQTVIRQTKSAQFQLLHLSLLREYLSLDFAFECPWIPDQERLFDDFIFLTFLVGNDFLPHLPSRGIFAHELAGVGGAAPPLRAVRTASSWRRSRDTSCRTGRSVTWPA